MKPIANRAQVGRLESFVGDDSRANGFQLERKPRLLLVSVSCEREGVLLINHHTEPPQGSTYGSSDIAAIAWLMSS